MGWQILEKIKKSIPSTTTKTSLQKENLLLTNEVQQKKSVYISLDIETGGENCGLVQLSAQIFHMVQQILNCMLLFY